MTHIGSDVRNVLSAIQVVLARKMLHPWVNTLFLTEADERPHDNTEVLTGNCWYRAVRRTNAFASVARRAGVEQLFSMCGTRFELHDRVEFLLARRAGVTGDRRGTDCQQSCEQKRSSNVLGRAHVHHEWDREVAWLQLI